MDPVSIVLGGFASGMVLFIVSVGLSVTMGLMGFVNLAHGGFAMLGGYAIVLAMKHWGPESQVIRLPDWLRGQTDLGFIKYRTYSVALILTGTALVAGLWLGFERTR